MALSSTPSFVSVLVYAKTCCFVVLSQALGDLLVLWYPCGILGSVVWEMGLFQRPDKASDQGGSGPHLRGVRHCLSVCSPSLQSSLEDTFCFLLFSFCFIYSWKSVTSSESSPGISITIILVGQRLHWEACPKWATVQRKVVNRLWAALRSQLDCFERKCSLVQRTELTWEMFSHSTGYLPGNCHCKTSRHNVARLICFHLLCVHAAF